MIITKHELSQHYHKTTYTNYHKAKQSDTHKGGGGVFKRRGGSDKMKESLLRSQSMFSMKHIILVVVVFRSTSLILVVVVFWIMKMQKSSSVRKHKRIRRVSLDGSSCLGQWIHAGQFEHFSFLFILYFSSKKRLDFTDSLTPNQVLPTQFQISHFSHTKSNSHFHHTK
jgi:uncharacterized membrane protein YsdA (DUF1294 family)